MINLHWHSNFSLLDATTSIKDIIATAQKNQSSAIALTDYWGMYGAIEFYQQAQKAGIKPIIWVDLPIVQTITSASPKDYKPVFATFIARNYEWYLELLKLTTRANTIGVYNEIPRIDFTQLQNLKNVYMIIGAHNSILWEAILNNASLNHLQQLIQQFVDLLGQDNVILEFEIQDFEILPQFQILRETKKKLQNQLIAIITSNFHYAKPWDKQAFWASLEIKYWTGQIPYFFKKGEFHIRNEEEVLKITKKNKLDNKCVQQLIKNTQHIAKNINIQMPMVQVLFPDYRPSKKTQQLYNQYQQILDAKE